MNRVVLGVDLDGTLADLHGVWIDRYNLTHSPKLSREGWKDFFHYDLSLTGDQKPNMEKVLGMLHPDMYEETKPFDGAREVIRALRERKDVSLRVVTANPLHDEKDFERMKIKWLEKHIPELAEGVIFARDKSGRGLDILIDDAPHNLTNTEYTPVVIDRPWNQHFSCKHRFEHWHQAERILTPLVLMEGRKKEQGQRIPSLRKGAGCAVSSVYKAEQNRAV